MRDIKTVYTVLKQIEKAERLMDHLGTQYATAVKPNAQFEALGRLVDAWSAHAELIVELHEVTVATELRTKIDAQFKVSQFELDTMRAMWAVELEEDGEFTFNENCDLFASRVA